MYLQSFLESDYVISAQILLGGVNHIAIPNFKGAGKCNSSYFQEEAYLYLALTTFTLQFCNSIFVENKALASHSLNSTPSP